jgi:hypothetical protein
VDQEAQKRRLDGRARNYFYLADHGMGDRRRDRGQPGDLQQKIAHRMTHHT